MTQTGYANAIVNLMLGWLKGLANWVLKLFNLAGSGGSPLLWLSQNWLKLLLVCLVIGTVVDWLVWMIRWRPYWVWFRKKRVIVNDERFLADADFEALEFADDDDPLEQNYVVPSTVVQRRIPRQTPQKPRSVPKTRRPGSAVPAKVQRRPRQPIPEDDLFEVGHNQDEYSDFFEDEVFNVSNLPEAQEARVPRKRRK